MYISETAYKSKYEITESNGDFSITKCVYEVENGFVIYIEKRKKPQEGKEQSSSTYYEPECSCYISKTNPIKASKEKEDNIKGVEALFEDNY